MPTLLEAIRDATKKGCRVEFDKGTFVGDHNAGDLRLCVRLGMYEMMYTYTNDTLERYDKKYTPEQIVAERVTQMADKLIENHERIQVHKKDM